MSVPETTSAEAFWRYAGGECPFESRGEAWRDIKAWVTALPPDVKTARRTYGKGKPARPFG